MADDLRKHEAKGLANRVLGPNMLDYRQLAEFLGLSLRATKRWVATGKLPEPDLRIANVVRWRPATIEKWLAKHRPEEHR